MPLPEIQSLTRPRPIEDPDPPWMLHVSTKAGDGTALCGAFVLTHCQPPKAVELGRRRPDGSEILLSEVELEAGWLATVPRHPEHGTVGELCRACLERVERMRWPGRAKHEKLAKVRAKVKTAKESKRGELAAKAKEVQGKLAQAKQAAASGRTRTRTKIEPQAIDTWIDGIAKKAKLLEDDAADEYGDE